MIVASGCVDVALLADIANAARLVSADVPVQLDLSRLRLLDDASSALVASWSETGIVTGASVVRVTRPFPVSSRRPGRDEDLTGTA
ncbi:MAG TPA: hypothetical protein VGL49_02905 [Acidimicrobiales bacterium]